MKNRNRKLKNLKFNKEKISNLNNIKAGEAPTTGDPIETFPNVGNCFDPFSENGQCISFDGNIGCTSMNGDIDCIRDTGTVKVDPPNMTDVRLG